jgi:hypothetical protein
METCLMPACWVGMAGVKRETQWCGGAVETVVSWCGRNCARRDGMVDAVVGETRWCGKHTAMVETELL